MNNMLPVDVNRIEAIKKEIRDKIYIDSNMLESILDDIDNLIEEFSNKDESTRVEFNGLLTEIENNVDSIIDIYNNKNDLFNDIKLNMENEYDKIHEQIDNYISTHLVNINFIRDMIYNKIKSDLFSKKVEDRIGDPYKDVVLLKNNKEDDDTIFLKTMKYKPHANWRLIPAYLDERVEFPLFEIETLPATYRKSELKNNDLGAFLIEFKLAGDNVNIKGIIHSGELNTTHYGAVFSAEYCINPNKIPIKINAYKAYEIYMPKFKKIGTFDSVSNNMRRVFYSIIYKKFICVTDSGLFYSENAINWNVVNRFRPISHSSTPHLSDTYLESNNENDEIITVFNATHTDRININDDRIIMTRRYRLESNTLTNTSKVFSFNNAEIYFSNNNIMCFDINNDEKRSIIETINGYNINDIDVFVSLDNSIFIMVVATESKVYYTLKSTNYFNNDTLSESDFKELHSLLNYEINKISIIGLSGNNINSEYNLLNTDKILLTVTDNNSIKWTTINITSNNNLTLDTASIGNRLESINTDTDPRFDNWDIKNIKVRLITDMCAVILARNSNGIMCIFLTLIKRIDSINNAHKFIDDPIIKDYTDFIGIDSGLDSTEFNDFDISNNGNLIITYNNKYNIFNVSFPQKVADFINNADEHPLNITYDNFYKQKIIFTVKNDNNESNGFDFKSSIILGNSFKTISFKEFAKINTTLLSYGDTTITGHGNFTLTETGTPIHNIYTNVFKHNTGIFDKKIDWGKSRLDNIELYPSNYEQRSTEEAIIENSTDNNVIAIIDKIEKYYTDRQREIPIGRQLECKGFIIINNKKYNIEKAMFVSSNENHIDELYFVIDRDQVFLTQDYIKDKDYIKPDITERIDIYNNKPVVYNTLNTNWGNYIYDIINMDSFVYILMDVEKSGNKTRVIRRYTDTLEDDSYDFEVVSDTKLNSVGYYKDSDNKFRIYNNKKSGIDKCELLSVTNILGESVTINDIAYTNIFENNSGTYIDTELGRFKLGNNSWEKITNPSDIPSVTSITSFDSEFGNSIIYTDDILKNMNFKVDNFSKNLMFNINNHCIGIIIHNINANSDNVDVIMDTELKLYDNFIGVFIVDTISNSTEFVRLSYDTEVTGKLYNSSEVLYINPLIKFNRFNSDIIKDFIIFCDKNHIYVTNKNNSYQVFIKDNKLLNNKYQYYDIEMGWKDPTLCSINNFDLKNKNLFFKWENIQYFIDYNIGIISIYEIDTKDFNKIKLINSIEYKNHKDTDRVLGGWGDPNNGDIYLSTDDISVNGFKIYKLSLLDGAYTEVSLPDNTSTFLKDTIVYDSNIYLIPRDNEFFLLLDLLNGDVKTKGNSLGNSSNKFKEVITIGTTVYCIPNSYTKVFKLYLKSGTLRAAGDALQEYNNRFSNVIIKGDSIYCIPDESNVFLSISNNTVTSYGDTELGNSNNKFIDDYIISSNGDIYLIPNTETNVWKLDINTHVFSKLADLGSNHNKFSGYIYSNDKTKAFLVSNNFDRLIYINFSDDTIHDIDITDINKNSSHICDGEEVIVYVTLVPNRLFIINKNDLSIISSSFIDSSIINIGYPDIRIFLENADVIGVIVFNKIILVNRSRNAISITDITDNTGSFIINEGMCLYYTTDETNTKVLSYVGYFSPVEYLNSGSIDRYYDTDDYRIYIPETGGYIFSVNNKLSIPNKNNIIKHTISGGINDKFIETIIETDDNVFLIPKNSNHIIYMNKNNGIFVECAVDCSNYEFSNRVIISENNNIITKIYLLPNINIGIDNISTGSNIIEIDANSGDIIEYANALSFDNNISEIRKAATIDDKHYFIKDNSSTIVCIDTSDNSVNTIELDNSDDLHTFDNVFTRIKANNTLYLTPHGKGYITEYNITSTVTKNIKLIDNTDTPNEKINYTYINDGEDEFLISTNKKGDILRLCDNTTLSKVDYDFTINKYSWANGISVGKYIYIKSSHDRHMIKLNTETDEIIKLNKNFGLGTKFKAKPILIGNFIYFIPWEYNSIVKVNIETDEITNVGDTFTRGHRRFYCAEVVNTNIYLIPAEHTHIAKFDTNTDTWKNIGGILGAHNNWKFLGSTVATANGKTYIYAPQHDNRTNKTYYTVIIDTDNDTVEQKGIPDNTGRLYTDAQYANGHVYFTPCHKRGIVKVNVNDNNIVETLGADIFESNFTGVYLSFVSVMIKNYIFYIPNNLYNIIRLDINDDSVVTFGRRLLNVEAPDPYSDFRSCAVYNDDIYIFPFTHNYIIKINTSKKPNDEDAWVVIGDLGTSTRGEKFWNGIVTAGTSMYGFPSKYDKIIKLDFSPIVKTINTDAVDIPIDNINDSYESFIIHNEIYFKHKLSNKIYYIDKKSNTMKPISGILNNTKVSASILDNTIENNVPQLKDIVNWKEDKLLFFNDTDLFSTDYAYKLDSSNKSISKELYDYIWDVIGDELVDGDSGGVKFISHIVVGTDIYCLPLMYDYIIKIDTITDTWKRIGRAFDHNIENFITNPILIGTDLYCIPHNYDHIVKVDTIADTWEDIGSPFTGFYFFWSMPILVGTDLYCIPYYHDHIVKIDTTTDTWSNIGIDLGTSSNKFRLSVKVGTNIYCIPYYYDYIVKIDTTTDIVTKVGNSLGSSVYKFNTVIVKDDNIYCIPYRYEYIISFNVTNNVWKHIGRERSADLKYQVSILVNDKIYCVPYQYSHITVVDTTNNSVTDVGESLGDTTSIKVMHAHLVGRYIYCFGFARGDYFKRFNIDTYEWEDIGDSRGDVNNSEVVSVLINNSIYAIPFAGNKIRKVRLPNIIQNSLKDYIITNDMNQYNKLIDNYILNLKINHKNIGYSIYYYGICPIFLYSNSDYTTFTSENVIENCKLGHLHKIYRFDDNKYTFVFENGYTCEVNLETNKFIIKKIKGNNYRGIADTIDIVDTKSLDIKDTYNSIIYSDFKNIALFNKEDISKQKSIYFNIDNSNITVNYIDCYDDLLVTENNSIYNTSTNTKLDFINKSGINENNIFKIIKQDDVIYTFSNTGNIYALYEGIMTCIYQTEFDIENVVLYNDSILILTKIGTIEQITLTFNIDFEEEDKTKHTKLILRNLDSKYKDYTFNLIRKSDDNALLYYKIDKKDKNNNIYTSFCVYNTTNNTLKKIESKSNELFDVDVTF